VIQSLADASGDELSSTQLFQAFEQEYLRHAGPYQLEYVLVEQIQGVETFSCEACLRIDGIMHEVRGQGCDPIQALVHALMQGGLASFSVESYTAHVLHEGSDAQRAAYVQIQTTSGERFFGAAIEKDSAVATARAIISALNRSVVGQEARAISQMSLG
jgi:2-isopropylmalate synthase